MKLIVGLLLLLAACIVAGFVRKVRGGSFLPPQDHDGAHSQDRKGRWWRYNEDSNSIEDAFPRHKK